MPIGRGYGGPTSGRDFFNRIKDRFLGGVEGQVYTTGGDGIKPDRNGVRGNMLDGTDIGGIIGIRARGRNVRVGPGDDARDVVRATNAITGQVAETAQGIDDIKTGRYDVGRAQYRDAPRDTSRRGKRNSGPEQYEQDYLRQSGEIAPDDAAPQVTKPQELESEKVFSNRPLSQEESVARWDIAQKELNSGKFEYSEIVSSMQKNNPGQYQMFTKAGFSQDKAGLNELYNFNREFNQNPDVLKLNETFAYRDDISRGVLEQWRKDVGADSSSPTYRGGKETILDKIGHAAQDPDKLDMLQRSANWHEFKLNLGIRDQAPGASSVRTIDPNTALPDTVAVQTSSGQVNIPKGKPSDATFEPAKPTTQIAGIEIKSGEPMTTALLNKFSEQGIHPVSVGQGKDAVTVYMKEGKVVGGYERKAGDVDNGHFVGLDQLKTQLAQNNKSIEQVEAGAQAWASNNMKETLAAFKKPEALASVDGPKPDVAIKLGLGATGGPSV